MFLTEATIASKCSIKKGNISALLVEKVKDRENSEARKMFSLVTRTEKFMCRIFEA